MTASRNLAATRAANRLMIAQRAVSAARKQLAATTRPGHAPVIHSLSWERAKATLERHRTRLLAMPGVVGLGVSYRRTKGLRTGDTPCVTVFVKRKLGLGALRATGRPRVPASLVSSGGPRIPTDVVEFGQLSLHVNAGDGVGPGTISERGTLGTFAVDLDTSNVVALTAMHVIGGPDTTTPDPARVINSPSMPAPSSRRLGSLLRGSVNGVDAAAVSIDPPQSGSMNANGIGSVAGWRPLTNPGDVGTAVMMYGAETANLVYGRVVEPSISLPDYGLDDAILVDIPSINGDSGAAILDNDRLVLGLLVGESSTLGHRVFTPIASVLARLRCDIPSR